MTRFGYVMAICFACVGVAIASVVSLPTKLVWNTSASTPIGLYDLDPPHHLAVGDLVAAMPPNSVAGLMVSRGYIGRHVPLLKHIAALPGQVVCRTGKAVTVNGRPLGDALKRDRMRRPLPVWQGCRRLAADEIFLMNPAVPDSFDGRYFGPTPTRTVIGKAMPLYTDEQGDGRFTWRTQKPGPAR